MIFSVRRQRLRLVSTYGPTYNVQCGLLLHGGLWKLLYSVNVLRVQGLRNVVN